MLAGCSSEEVPCHEEDTGAISLSRWERFESETLVMWNVKCYEWLIILVLGYIFLYLNVHSTKKHANVFEYNP